jgi:hypothetical protein
MFLHRLLELHLRRSLSRFDQGLTLHPLSYKYRLAPPRLVYIILQESRALAMYSVLWNGVFRYTLIISRYIVKTSSYNLERTQITNMFLVSRQTRSLCPWGMSTGTLILPRVCPIFYILLSSLSLCLKFGEKS